MDFSEDEQGILLLMMAELSLIANRFQEVYGELVSTRKENELAVTAAFNAGLIQEITGMKIALVPGSQNASSSE